MVVDVVPLITSAGVAGTGFALASHGTRSARYWWLKKIRKKRKVTY
jgi:hypothetical protein